MSDYNGIYGWIVAWSLRGGCPVIMVWRASCCRRCSARRDRKKPVNNRRSIRQEGLRLTYAWRDNCALIDFRSAGYWNSAIRGLSIVSAGVRVTVSGDSVIMACGAIIDSFQARLRIIVWRSVAYESPSYWTVLTVACSTKKGTGCAVPNNLFVWAWNVFRGNVPSFYIR